VVWRVFVLSCALIAVKKSLSLLRRD